MRETDGVLTKAIQQVLRVELHILRPLIRQEVIDEVAVLYGTLIAADALPEVTEEVRLGWNCNLTVTIEEGREQGRTGSSAADDEDRLEHSRRS